MPADKDLPPTALQRSLVRHKAAWRFCIVAVAVLAFAFSIWGSLSGEANALGWLITAVAAINVFTIFGNIAASERQIRHYDARPPA